MKLINNFEPLNIISMPCGKNMDEDLLANVDFKLSPDENLKIKFLC